MDKQEINSKKGDLNPKISVITSNGNWLNTHLKYKDFQTKGKTQLYVELNYMKVLH